MKIAIIGAGFTGLSAAYELSKRGHDVSVFEKDLQPGGLAIGYKEREWKWTIEKYYHHWFTNDRSILNLAKELNCEVVTKRPKTSVYVKGKIYQLDSPLSVITFPLLSIMERLRMGLVLECLKLNPFGKSLEKYNSSKVLPRLMGKRPFELVWEPLFKNKFGKHMNNISLAWFWARVKKRTPSLSYPKEGFLRFAEKMVKKSEENNAKFYFNTEVIETRTNNKVSIKFQRGGKIEKGIFDKAIITLPSFMFKKIAPQLPENYNQEIIKLEGLGTVTLILRLKKSFLTDGTYWLNLCDKNAPFTAIVEHTNYMDKKFYNKEHLVYLGDYKSPNNLYFSLSKESLLKKFDPYLRKINPNYSSDVIDYKLFKVPYSQPIIPKNYSQILPPFITPLPNIYLASIEQVYPWDRGTNYAVELGQEIAKICMQDLEKKF